MKQTKQVFYWSSLLVLILVLVTTLFSKVGPSVSLVKTTPTPTPTKVGINVEKAHVSRIVDGDTIVLSNEKTVRYIGIDTPELHHTDSRSTCYGKEAAARNKELVENKDITLEKDVSETDKFGRLLRYVYVDGKPIELILVREGYARAKDYPPDSHYKKLFADAEVQAKLEHKGLWEKCI